MGHHDAVKYLSALRGTIRFDLENNIEADIDEVCDMDTRLYQFHISEQDGDFEEKATTAANRMTLSYPGKAKDVRSTSTISPTTKVSEPKTEEERPKPKSQASPQQQQPKKSELPKVHAFASPSKAKTSSPSSSSETQSPKTSTL